MDTQLTVNKLIFSLYIQFRVVTGNNSYICFILFHIVPFRAARCVYQIAYQI
ncbi:hypothetical protein [Salmonella enterica]|uniref:hypothetical protein n=1 Tax=Salmonella enterica TaxID=28901 RepID=UPI001CEDB9B3|nr:hypothetical protein [Salmonella enterica]